LHAISMAGGVLDSGSYRNIDIIRKGKVIDTLDLYDLFIYGNSSFGPNLTSGDSIFIRPVGKIVNATVGVRRPSEYELMGSETVGDLIYFANGLSKISDTDYLAIERASNNEVNVLTFKDIEVFYKEIPKDGDTIFIREFSYRTVSIKGAVSVPGDYIITEGETLSNIINRAGGYKEFAYPFGGFLNNQRAREINELAKDKLYDSFLRSIIQNSSAAKPDNNLPLILEQLRNSEVSGRVMAEFDLNIILKDKDLDTTLENGDDIFIPYITQQVYIYGEVNSVGTVRYNSGKDIQYYIENSGGFLESADTKNIYIVHPNGKTQRLKKYSKGLSFITSPEYTPVYPGSIIFISKKSLVQTPTLIASIWAPIISSIALSIASVSALNN